MSAAVVNGTPVLETVDRRALGAFICVDAITGLSVVQAIPVSAGPWTVKPNRSGVYVIFDGPGFDALTGQFIPTGTWPAAVSFEVTLTDANRRYLPRRASVKAPMAAPTIGRVTLYPLPSSAVGPNWSTIHASVTRQGTTPAAGLPWAVLQVVRQSDKAVLATGQSDANGEALLAVVGLTMQAGTSASGPVTVSTVPVTVTAYFDPTVLTQPQGWIANPDDILSNLTNATLKSTSQTVQMGPGMELSLSFAIAV